MSITLIAYHAIKDEKGRATFIMISTKKYGFIFYMNEKWEEVQKYAETEGWVFKPHD